MAAPLYTDITALVRAWLNDIGIPGGAVWDDATAQVYVGSAQVTLQNTLIANGISRMLFRTQFTLTAGKVHMYHSWDPGTAPDLATGQQSLPDEMVTPDQLWESKVGGTEQDFFGMNHGLLPNLPQTDTLRYWDFRQDRVVTLGSTVDRVVRMDYQGTLGAINPASYTLVLNGMNATAALICAQIARARGQHDAARSFADFSNVQQGGEIGGQAGYEISQIVQADLKVSHADPVRRQSYFGVNRYSNEGPGVRGRQ